VGLTVRERPTPAVRERLWTAHRGRALPAPLLSEPHYAERVASPPLPLRNASPKRQPPKRRKRR
jgi:hypothetical protein